MRVPSVEEVRLGLQLKTSSPTIEKCNQGRRSVIQFIQLNVIQLQFPLPKGWSVPYITDIFKTSKHDKSNLLYLPVLELQYATIVQVVVLSKHRVLFQLANVPVTATESTPCTMCGVYGLLQVQIGTSTKANVTYVCMDVTPLHRACNCQGCVVFS